MPRTRRRDVALRLRKVRYEKKGHIAFVTIDNAKHENCLEEQVDHDLWGVWRDFRDDPKLYVAILTGAGTKSFCAGSDLRYYVETISKRSPDRNRRRAHEGPNLGGITKGIDVWKPIIAAINGYCLAGGLELALACDIRVAAEHASFGLPEPKRAIIPAAGGTQRLPRAVPLAFAMELLLTGNRFDAQTALRFGLVSRVVPADRLMATAEEIAAGVLECGPLAVRAIKQAAMQGREMSLEDGLKLESQMAGRVFQSEDAREGPTAFAQKRKPEYKGQ